MSIDTQFWLNEVAQSCTSTLAVLQKKAEQQKQITDGDQMMSEICMGYLYLLHKADSEGILDTSSVSIGQTIKHTIH
jgi:hypothetical protein